MKIARVGPDEIFHRYLTPKWAFLSTSGAGAAVDGGRFNRPGVEALYLSRSAQTALEEYRQGTSIVPPAALAAYKITLADLSRGFDPNAWDGSPGSNGIVPGARLPGSTREFRRRGSWRTWSSPQGCVVSCFPRFVTPAAPIWLSFLPTLSTAIMS